MAEFRISLAAIFFSLCLLLNGYAQLYEDENYDEHFQNWEPTKAAKNRGKPISQSDSSSPYEITTNSSPKSTSKDNQRPRNRSNLDFNVDAQQNRNRPTTASENPVQRTDNYARRNGNSRSPLFRGNGKATEDAFNSAVHKTRADGPRNINRENNIRQYERGLSARRSGGRGDEEYFLSRNQLSNKKSGKPENTELFNTNGAEKGIPSAGASRFNQNTPRPFRGRQLPDEKQETNIKNETLAPERGRSRGFSSTYKSMAEGGTLPDYINGNIQTLSYTDEPAPTEDTDQKIFEGRRSSAALGFQAQTLPDSYSTEFDREQRRERLSDQMNHNQYAQNQKSPQPFAPNSHAFALTSTAFPTVEFPKQSKTQTKTGDLSYQSQESQQPILHKNNAPAVFTKQRYPNQDQQVNQSQTASRPSLNKNSPILADPPNYTENFHKNVPENTERQKSETVDQSRKNQISRRIDGNIQETTPQMILLNSSKLRSNFRRGSRARHQGNPNFNAETTQRSTTQAANSQRREAEERGNISGKVLPFRSRARLQKVSNAPVQDEKTGEIETYVTGGPLLLNLNEGVSKTTEPTYRSIRPQPKVSSTKYKAEEIDETANYPKEFIEKLKSSQGFVPPPKLEEKLSTNPEERVPEQETSAFRSKRRQAISTLMPRFSTTPKNLNANEESKAKPRYSQSFYRKLAAKSSNNSSGQARTEPEEHKTNGAYKTMKNRFLSRKNFRSSSITTSTAATTTTEPESPATERRKFIPKNKLSMEERKLRIAILKEKVRQNATEAEMKKKETLVVQASTHPASHEVVSANDSTIKSVSRGKHGKSIRHLSDAYSSESKGKSDSVFDSGRDLLTLGSEEVQEIYVGTTTTATTAPPSSTSEQSESSSTTAGDFSVLNVTLFPSTRHRFSSKINTTTANSSQSVVTTTVPSVSSTSFEKPDVTSMQSLFNTLNSSVSGTKPLENSSRAQLSSSSTKSLSSITTEKPSAPSSKKKSPKRKKPKKKPKTKSSNNRRTTEKPRGNEKASRVRTLATTVRTTMDSFARNSSNESVGVGALPLAFSEIEGIINDTIKVVNNNPMSSPMPGTAPRSELDALTPKTISIFNMSAAETTEKAEETSLTTTNSNNSTNQTESPTAAPGVECVDESCKNATSPYLQITENPLSYATREGTTKSPEALRNIFVFGLFPNNTVRKRPFDGDARRGQIRNSSMPALLRSTTTMRPYSTGDYVVFGIYPNNSVVRRRGWKTFDHEKYQSPYVIFGIYPNNTIVKKYPNGTTINDEFMISDNEIKNMTSDKKIDGGCTCKNNQTNRITINTTTEGTVTTERSRNFSTTVNRVEAKIENDYESENNSMNNAESAGTKKMLTETDAEDESKTEENIGLTTIESNDSPTTVAGDRKDSEEETEDENGEESETESEEEVSSTEEDFSTVAADITTENLGELEVAEEIDDASTPESVLEEDTNTDREINRESYENSNGTNDKGNTSTAKEEPEVSMALIEAEEADTAKISEAIKSIEDSETEASSSERATTDEASVINKNETIYRTVIEDPEAFTVAPVEKTTETSESQYETITEPLKTTETKIENEKEKLDDSGIFNFLFGDSEQRVNDRVNVSATESATTEVTSERIGAFGTNKDAEQLPRGTTAGSNAIARTTENSLSSLQEQKLTESMPTEQNTKKMSEENFTVDLNFNLENNGAEEDLSSTTAAIPFVTRDEDLKEAEVLQELALSKAQGGEYEGSTINLLPQTPTHDMTHVEQLITQGENSATAPSDLNTRPVEAGCRYEKPSEGPLGTDDIFPVSIDKNYLNNDRGSDTLTFRSTSPDFESITGKPDGDSETRNSGYDLDNLISRLSTIFNTEGTESTNFDNLYSTTDGYNTESDSTTSPDLLNALLPLSLEYVRGSSNGNVIKKRQRKPKTKSGEPSRLTNLAHRALNSKKEGSTLAQSTTVTPPTNSTVRVKKKKGKSLSRMSVTAYKNKMTKLTSAPIPESVFIVTPVPKMEGSPSQEGKVKLVTLMPEYVVTTDIQNDNDFLTMSSQHVQKVTKAPANIPDNFLSTVFGEIEEKVSSPIPDILKSDLHGNGLSANLARRIITLAFEKAISSTTTPQTTFEIQNDKYGLSDSKFTTATATPTSTTRPTSTTKKDTTKKPIATTKKPVFTTAKQSRMTTVTNTIKPTSTASSSETPVTTVTGKTIDTLTPDSITSKNTVQTGRNESKEIPSKHLVELSATPEIIDNKVVVQLYPLEKLLARANESVAKPSNEQKGTEDLNELISGLWQEPVVTPTAGATPDEKPTLKSSKRDQLLLSKKATDSLSPSDLEILKAIITQQKANGATKDLEKIVQNQIRLAEEVRKASRNLKKKKQTTTTTTKRPPFRGLTFLLNLLGGGRKSGSLETINPKRQRPFFDSNGNANNTPDPFDEFNDEQPPAERTARGQLVTAAIDVTKAVSKFMGTVLSNAAQSFQNFIRNFRS